MESLRPPVVILGAPRSGTNLLRDVLCSLPGLGTWPCDEINPIWRHGNRHLHHDVLTRDHARPEVRAFIRRAFARQQRRLGAVQLVEKTCASTLRVPFVGAVLPEARFLLIERDGREAAASAATRWTAPFELRYTLRKLRFAPMSDLPGLLAEFGTRRVRQAFSEEPELDVWGPVFPDLPEILQEEGVHAAAAAQWSACVRSARAGIADLEPARVHALRYEDFVKDPTGTIRDLLSWLSHDVEVSRITKAVVSVDPGRGGRRPESVPDHVRARMLDHLTPGLEELDVEPIG